MASDPTTSIVQRHWSEWVFIGGIDLGPRFNAPKALRTPKGRTTVEELLLNRRPTVYEIARLPGNPDEPHAPPVSLAYLPWGLGQVLYVGRTRTPREELPTRPEPGRLNMVGRDTGEAPGDVHYAVNDALYARFIQLPEGEHAAAAQLEYELVTRLGPLGRYPWNRREAREPPAMESATPAPTGADPR